MDCDLVVLCPQGLVKLCGLFWARNRKPLERRMNEDGELSLTVETRRGGSKRVEPDR